MRTSAFYSETLRVADKLNNIRPRVSQTISVLERLFNVDGDIEIHEWTIRSGKIYITLGLPSPVEAVSHILPTLTALFPTCRYSDVLLEIEESELL